MTDDLDQTLELIGGVVLVLFLLPFVMGWLEGTLDRQPGTNHPSPWRVVRERLPDRWPWKSR